MNLPSELDVKNLLVYDGKAFTKQTGAISGKRLPTDVPVPERLLDLLAQKRESVARVTAEKQALVSGVM